jgi:hypothetical protein
MDSLINTIQISINAFLFPRTGVVDVWLTSDSVRTLRLLTSEATAAAAAWGGPFDGKEPLADLRGVVVFRSRATAEPRFRTLVCGSLD